MIQLIGGTLTSPSTVNYDNQESTSQPLKLGKTLKQATNQSYNLTCEAVGHGEGQDQSECYGSKEMG